MEYLIKIERSICCESSHYSPNNQVTISGPLGHFMIRGKEENSLQGQLYKQIKSKVHFSSFVQPEDLEKDFNHVIVADGYWGANGEEYCIKF